MIMVLHQTFAQMYVLPHTCAQCYPMLPPVAGLLVVELGRSVAAVDFQCQARQLLHCHRQY